MYASHAPRVRPQGMYAIGAQPGLLPARITGLRPVQKAFQGALRGTLEEGDPCLGGAQAEPLLRTSLGANPGRLPSLTDPPQSCSAQDVTAMPAPKTDKTSTPAAQKPATWGDG